MKKFIMFMAICLCSVMYFSLVACNNKAQAKTSEVKGEKTSETKEIKKDALWDLEKNVDEFTNETKHTACLVSTNYVMQDFPYHETKFMLFIRNTKKYGDEVLVSVMPGIIDGNEYYGTNYIEVKFNGGEIKKYYFNDSDGGNCDTKFLNSSKRFIKECENAKDISVRVRLYNHGNATFNFHVDKPIEWQKHKQS